MEWIQPALLWGFVGLAIPLIIHLWNRKKEQVIYWAAMSWLNQEESQSSRSLKLEHWILLLLRMVLLILLVALLAGIFWKGFDFTGKESNVLHAVVPDEQVAEEFRFELEQAVQKGHSVHWLASGFPVYSLESVTSLDFSPNNLQAYLDEIPDEMDSIYLYTALESSIFPKNTYWVPVIPKIRIAENYKISPDLPSLRLSSGETLTLDQGGNLVRLPVTSTDSALPSNPFTMAFGQMSESKKNEILRALNAIKEVYGMTFQEESLTSAQFIFSDDSDLSLTGNQFLFLTGNQEFTTSDQEYALASSRFQSWDQIARKGILPELILTQVLKKMGFENRTSPISFSQVEQKFHQIPASQKALTANTNELLIAIFLVLFFLERALSFRAGL